MGHPDALVALRSPPVKDGHIFATIIDLGPLKYSLYEAELIERWAQGSM